MKMWKDVVGNFEKQHKRMAKQSETGGSKSGKKGEFKNAAHKLLAAGGGNKSALSCAGSTDNAGAKQLKNLTDFLHKCEDEVHMVCNSTNFDLVNVTKLEACKAHAENFKAHAEMCLGKTVGAKKTRVDDACACWTNSTLDGHAQNSKECKFNDEAKAHATALKACRNKFSECRKYEDEAAHSISACSSNSADLLKSVATLTANADKVKEAQAVVKALANSTRRVRRAAAGSCTEVNNIAVKVTALVIEFPGAPDILVYTATIIASSSLVCTSDEKTALAAVDAAFEEANSVLADAVEAAHDQLMTLTGTTPTPEMVAAAQNSTASAAEPSTPAPTSTMRGRKLRKFI